MVVGVTIATITILLMGGKSGPSFVNPESIRKSLKRVKDPERRERAFEIVDSMQGIVEEYDEELRASFGLYLKMVGDYSVEPHEILESVFGPIEERRLSGMHALIRLRTQLQESVLEKEWTKIFGKPERAEDQ